MRWRYAPVQHQCSTENNVFGNPNRTHAAASMLGTGRATSAILDEAWRVSGVILLHRAAPGFPCNLFCNSRIFPRRCLRRPWSRVDGLSSLCVAMVSLLGVLLGILRAGSQAHGPVQPSGMPGRVRAESGRYRGWKGGTLGREMASTGCTAAPVQPK